MLGDSGESSQGGFVVARKVVDVKPLDLTRRGGLAYSGM